MVIIIILLIIILIHTSSVVEHKMASKIHPENMETLKLDDFAETMCDVSGMLLKLDNKHGRFHPYAYDRSFPITQNNLITLRTIPYIIDHVTEPLANQDINRWAYRRKLPPQANYVRRDIPYQCHLNNKPAQVSTQSKNKRGAFRTESSLVSRPTPLRPGPVSGTRSLECGAIVESTNIELGRFNVDMYDCIMPNCINC